MNGSLGDTADDGRGSDVEPLGLLDPSESPPGHESEPDPDFFPQENSFYWDELSRRQAGRPPTELFRVEMTTEFLVADLGAFSRWAIENADKARDLQFMEGEGEDGEDVLVASYDLEYYAVDNAWEVAHAALLILEKWCPPGSAIQSSCWRLFLAEEPDEASPAEPSALIVTLKANVGVVDLDKFKTWLLGQIGGGAVSAGRAADRLSRAGQALSLATNRVLPRLALPGIEMRRSEWRLTQIDEGTPPTWE